MKYPPRMRKSADKYFEKSKTVINFADAKIRSKSGEIKMASQKIF